MADTYTTEAIACGLSDVAGWLENEGWRDKHARTIRLGVERLRELGAAAGGEGFVLVPREPTDEMVWAGGTAQHDDFEDSSGIYRAMIAAAPSHPGEADRVGLEKAWSEHSPQEIVRRTRCMADETRDAVLWRDCCDLILERLGELAATEGQTPQPLPHPQAPNTLSEVEEAKAVLAALDPRMPPQRHVEKLRRSSMRMTLPANADKLLATADRIEAAIATLRREARDV